MRMVNYSMKIKETVTDVAKNTNFFPFEIPLENQFNVNTLK